MGEALLAILPGSVNWGLGGPPQRVPNYFYFLLHGRQIASRPGQGFPIPPLLTRSGGPLLRTIVHRIRNCYAVTKSDGLT